MMAEDKQIDIIIDLLIDFDEMGFIPTTTVPDPEAYAIKWRAEITKAFEDYRKQSEGEWRNLAKVGVYMCTACTQLSPRPYPYCPKCGAKMKGGAE